MLVNKREQLKEVKGLKTRKALSGLVCTGLLFLLLRVDLTTEWKVPGPDSIGDLSTERIGEHLFTDYLLPFEVASVLLLMAMIGAIVLARRDVLTSDIGTGDSVDQNLIEKSNDPILLEQSSN
tara:strand:- start:477 stop:845 length:369 start_codon:yes stop_codon:yes gene_type:complete